MALGIWLLGTSASVLTAISVEHRLMRTAEDQFHRIADSVRHEVILRLQRPLYLLSTTRTHVLHSPDFHRLQFAQYASAQDFVFLFAGIRGIGWIERVPRDALPQWLEQERADQAPDLQIHDLGITDDDPLYLIKYYEPNGRNTGGLGVDVGSEAHRRHAIESAIDRGTPTLTAPVHLLRDHFHSIGTVLYLPVYRSGAWTHSPATRRTALLGVLYAPLSLHELLSGVDLMTSEYLGLSLYDDAPAQGRPKLLFQNMTPAGQQFQSTLPIEIYGRSLSLIVTSSSSYTHAMANPLAWLIGLGGSFTSTLLALLLWLQVNKRRRAELLAQSMTQDLQRLALVAQNTSNAVIITDLKRRITWVNPGFERLSGYTAEEVVGRSPSLLQCRNTDPATIRQMREALNAGRGFQGELLNRRRDGKEYWLSMDIQPIHDSQGSVTGFLAVESDITERKQQQSRLESAMRENDALMSTLDLFGIVSTTDEHGCITSVNDAFCHISGYSREELIGHNHKILHSGIHPSSFWDDMWTCIRSGYPWRGEVCNRAKDLSLFWVDTFIASFIGDDGKPAKFVGIRIDITARKLAEQSLHWNQSLLRMMSESSPLGFLVVDGRTDKVLYSNRRFYEIWGISALSGDVDAGRMGFAALRATCQPMLSNDCVDCGPDNELLDPENRSTVEGELAFVGKRTVRWFSTQIRDEKDHYFGRFYLFEEITERRRSEALAQQYADLLAGSIDALDDAFALYDDQDTLVICNQRYRDVYPLCTDVIQPGHSFESVLRVGIERGQFQLDTPDAEQWLAERLALHRKSSSRFNQRLNDGRTLRIVERRMPNGYTVGFRVDITDLVAATEAAQEASRSKSQFLANMSHEIRTPMNAVLGMLTLLRKTELSPQQADYASKSESAAQSLLALINDILDLSKAEAGKMTLDPHPFHLAQLVSDLRVIVDAYIGNRPVQYEPDIDPALPAMLTGDSMRIKQVLVNLCGNAVKFTPKGRVTLSIRAVHHTPDAVHVQFSVQDEGIGIAPENQARIFSGFTQAESSTSRRYGGTGLGLAISQRLIALMGGKLELQSELGSGSQFHFTVPLQTVAFDAMPQPSTQTASDAPGSRLQGMRILVAEDNAVNRQIAQELLRGEGALVTLTEDGQEAVDAVLASETPFDVVLMDMQMPVMDGLTATRVLREYRDADTLPIVAMTANAMDSDRTACLEAGMNEHVGKPFHINGLVQMLRKVTGRAA
ncbi:PAS domain S-box protein [Candidatus Symbiobacter mobilis]|uniref:PAS domain S-box protein n=1 Tax=Candidatus Symbiobacter mobilis TaxID=1436290 RepID=UPI0016517C97|nr:PAS domain S-box protein [Candidatus Symbiobacter mobilis]